MINGLSVLVSLHHLLMEFGVGNLRADGNAALDGLLNLPDHRHQLGRSVDILGCHARLGRVKGRDLEDAVSFLNVLHLDLGLEVDSSDGLGETDDGFKLSHSDGDTSTLLGDLLILGVHAISHIHVLQDMAGLL
jgi:hypothetical protein